MKEVKSCDLSWLWHHSNDSFETDYWQVTWLKTITIKIRSGRKSDRGADQGSIHSLVVRRHSVSVWSNLPCLIYRTCRVLRVAGCRFFHWHIINNERRVLVTIKVCGHLEGVQHKSNPISTYLLFIGNCQNNILKQCVMNQDMQSCVLLLSITNSKITHAIT